MNPGHWRGRATALAAAALVAAVITIVAAAQSTPADGQCIFRHDTFGDEQLWTDVLRLHELAQSISPKTALSVGLKVDASGRWLRAGITLDDLLHTRLRVPDGRAGARSDQ